MLQSILDELQATHAIKFGDFTLRSGAHSPVYINLRAVISHPRLLKNLSEALYTKIKHLDFDFICGVPYSALAIATSLSITHDIPMVMRRKEPKKHGLGQTVEGDFFPGQSCIVVEDVMTTGLSILETIGDLEQAGLRVTAVATIVDREQGAKENLAKKGYEVYHVFTLREILDGSPNI